MCDIQKVLSPKGKYKMDIKNIEALAEIVKNYGLTSLEMDDADCKIKLKREPECAVTAVPIAPAAESVQTAEVQTVSGKPVKAPMVGVFYAASSPEEEPYVTVGSKVKKGDVLCIIEAMKLMNEITADCDGEIAEICAENEQVVEYGQTLFVIR